MLLVNCCLLLAPCSLLLCRELRRDNGYSQLSGTLPTELAGCSRLTHLCALLYHLPNVATTFCFGHLAHSKLNNSLSHFTAYVVVVLSGLLYLHLVMPLFTIVAGGWTIRTSAGRFRPSTPNSRRFDHCTPLLLATEISAVTFMAMWKSYIFDIVAISAFVPMTLCIHRNSLTFFTLREARNPLTITRQLTNKWGIVSYLDELLRQVCCRINAH